MKTKILLLILVTINGTAISLTQETNLKKGKIALENEKLKKAEKLLSKASKNDKTSQNHLTWQYLGEVYYCLATSSNKKERDLVKNAPAKSLASLKKSKSLQIAQTNSETFDSLVTQVGKLLLSEGAKHQKNYNFEKAFESFQMGIECGNLRGYTDSVAYLYSAIVSSSTSELNRTLEWYEKTLEIGYEEGYCAVRILEILDESKQKSEVKNRLAEFKKKYPKSVELMTYEINTLLKAGKNTEAANYIENALLITPNVKHFHFTLGSIRDHEGAQELAEKHYKNALEIDPDYVDANYSIGVIYYNKGADLYNESTMIDDLYQAKVKKDEAVSEFKKALPYLLKVEAKDPTNLLALTSLKTIYATIGDNENFKRVKDKISNL